MRVSISEESLIFRRTNTREDLSVVFEEMNEKIFEADDSGNAEI